MPRALLLVVALAACHDEPPAPPPSRPLDAASVERLARLALSCVHREYPNKISHVLDADLDVAPPRQLTPAFYGCFDWHSAVHGHWLLARVARLFPESTVAGEAREALRESLTAEKLLREAAYLSAEGRATFERPYGLAWLLTLAQELREWNDPLARELAANLAPLEEAAQTRLASWLAKLSHPVRSGEHSQTAFALGMLMDAARGRGDERFLEMLTAKARAFFEQDKSCPLDYEPSGEDFLSPCLAEADVMRRVLAPEEYARWMERFLPAGAQLRPEKVVDPSDGKLAHLDGLNLSRAWMLEGIASALSSRSRSSVAGAAAAHRDAGLASVTGEHYEGGHWLGTFAVYLVTGRGLPSASR